MFYPMNLSSKLRESPPDFLDLWQNVFEVVSEILICTALDSKYALFH